MLQCSRVDGTTPYHSLTLGVLTAQAPIAELCVLALRDPRAGWKPADGDPAKIGAAAAMLEEYLSIVIRDGALVALPQLIEGYAPPLNALPLFTLRLASHVDWLDRVGAVEEAESEAAATPAAGEAARTPAWTVQHVLLPSIRRSYEPPAAQSTDHTVVQVACTEQLYRIFERC
ncbi:hypothetical protein EMIHUDRAFT_107032 [Emiliania huxleyi CCMP1516]|uniref:DNA mismatch repair protein Mlh1 C-terminal domain-containing protein n=2 Tax=Emiliania huxleyi TaxID=2903 RepID=A0A0D3I4L1_EMIH1|nr:hypothetical protein EMIHUDRAFT_107032 [Emiliania huxleyi CCMP1516]EOD06196.1 hypothetical protein EMIHUDRAFT_107032 [Emiliania huxleyi CCMP1516]|eukprot:XP_005758625.1 hypothetical protein EMIHUDRAFT_107032 [Emiliania huxleyi CCMP1516]